MYDQNIELWSSYEIGKNTYIFDPNSICPLAYQKFWGVGFFIPFAQNHRRTVLNNITGSLALAFLGPRAQPQLQQSTIKLSISIIIKSGRFAVDFGLNIFLNSSSFPRPIASCT